MLILSKADILKVVDWRAAVEEVGQAFAALAAGRANVPLRTHFPLESQEGLLLLMPGYIEGPASSTGPEGQLAVKLVSIFNHNPARGLPLIYGLVTLFEADTGRPLALLEGATLTAIRTGAAGGAAAKYLANPQPSRLALFGTGVQAETQLKATLAVFSDSLREARVVGRDSLKTARFAERITAETGLPVRVAGGAAEALEGAEIVVTATTSYTPLFEDAMLAPGAHINGIGSYQPSMREVPGETVSRARLVVDAREAALHEAGDVVIPLQEGLIGPEHIYAELGEIVLGTRPGRAGFEPGEISFFKSVGNAAQDVAIAAHIYQKARAAGIGTEVEMF
ncbi:MAG: ornithine cyclodeaminase family protein [Chloroflexi bacterium]|nr:ornithine cyclodeaminase family protein [Chloroflexota bacterium]